VQLGLVLKGAGPDAGGAGGFDLSVDLAFIEAAVLDQSVREREGMSASV